VGWLSISFLGGGVGIISGQRLASGGKSGQAGGLGGQKRCK